MLRIIFAPVAAGATYIGIMGAWEIATHTVLEGGQAHGLVHLAHLVSGLSSPIIGGILGWKLGKRIENGPQPPAGPA